MVHSLRKCSFPLKNICSIFVLWSIQFSYSKRTKSKWHRIRNLLHESHLTFEFDANMHTNFFAQKPYCSFLYSIENLLYTSNIFLVAFAASPSNIFVNKYIAVKFRICFCQDNYHISNLFPVPLLQYNNWLAPKLRSRRFLDGCLRPY